MVDERVTRVVTSLAVFYGAMITGCSIGILSPTLPDMERLTGTNTAEMSTTFIWTGIACILGVLIVGRMFDRFNAMFLLSVCLTFQGVSLALAPTWPILVTFQILVTMVIVLHFAISSGSNTTIQKEWREWPSWQKPAIQTTNLMITLGAAITPQIVKPFLVRAWNGDSGSHDNGLQFDVTSTSNSTVTAAEQHDDGEFTQVRIAYAIIGALHVSAGIVSLIACIWASVRKGDWSQGWRVCLSATKLTDDVYLIPDGSDGITLHSSHEPVHGAKVEPSSRRGVTLLTITFLFFVMNGGRDILLTGLLFTYVEQYLHWSVADGTLLVTMYHVVRFIIHAALVPISGWVSPVKVNTVNLVALAVSAFLMLIAGDTGHGLTATGVLVAGIGTSNIHPTTITLVDESVRVTGAVMAMFFAAIGLSSMVFAPISGIFLFNIGPVSFPLMLVGQTAVGILLFIAYLIVLKAIQSKAPDDKLQEVHQEEPEEAPRSLSD